MPTWLDLVLVGVLYSGVLGYVIGASRGRDVAGSLLGLSLGPLGWFLASRLRKSRFYLLQERASRTFWRERQRAVAVRLAAYMTEESPKPGSPQRPPP